MTTTNPDQDLELQLAALWTKFRALQLDATSPDALDRRRATSSAKLLADETLVRALSHPDRQMQSAGRLVASQGIEHFVDWLVDEHERGIPVEHLCALLITLLTGTIVQSTVHWTHGSLPSDETLIRNATTHFEAVFRKTLHTYKREFLANGRRHD